jgi:nucleoside-diphosphate-sugar epimerase
MVIGNGMVANKFAKYKEQNDIIIFASGVSDSKMAIESEFEREKNLLSKVINNYGDKKLVYFSTFNLYDPIEMKSLYCVHKLDMEEFISKNVSNYNIFRLGHVAGVTAKNHTILSFLFNSIKMGTHFKLWKYASRNIIDIDDVFKICSYIIDNELYKNEITNVCSSYNTSIIEIVSVLEELMNKKGDYEIMNSGASPETNNTKIRPIADELGIHFDDFYVKNLIEKYYGYQVY